MKTLAPEKGTEPIASLVEEISALAEHARLHGPAPDCAARMETLVERHRARIEAARTIERDALRGQGDAA